MISIGTHTKNYIYVKMLHGAILYSCEPDEIFIAALHAIRRVRWDVVIHTSNRKFQSISDVMLPAHCNMVAILDPEFTSFGFLAALVRKGCHLFLTEKQKMTSNERMNLIRLAEEGNTFIQIRNDLLFHPSFLDNGRSGQESKFIEIHHVAPGKPGALQEMLYSNLLMILRIVESEPSGINVCSIPNSGYQPVVMNLHLNFNNGSAASLTLSFTGDKKEHLLSIHSARGVINYNFKENDLFPSSFNPGFESTLLFSNDLLFEQIAYFAECILRQDQRLGLNDEAKTFRLIEKINQKLEFSSILI